MGDLERVSARQVVVSALPLRRREFEAMAADLGPGFRLVDIRDAPERVDVVLAPPCSPQTIRRLCDSFPAARVVVIEVREHGSGLRVDGPVGRTLDGGASAYFVASSSKAIADFLRAAAAAAAETSTALPTPTIDDAVLAQLEALERRRRATPPPES